jgi:uncharacterized repeat protein (TIGR01451 family)
VGRVAPSPSSWALAQRAHREATALAMMSFSELHSRPVEHVPRHVWPALVASRAARALAAVLLAAAGTAQSFAAPLAGTLIQNRAQATYLAAGATTPSLLFSNIVEVEVAPQEALTLTATQTLSRPVGAQAVSPHVLTNTGNAVSSYDLAAANLGGDDFDLIGLTLVIDSNSNGVPDSTEPVVAPGPGADVALNPGTSVALLVVGSVPATASAGWSARVSLTATTILQGRSASNLDTVNVTAGAAISLFKSASNLAPAAGAQVQFTVRATNTGNATAGPVASVGAQSVLVDGVPRTLFLIADAIPANTRYVSGSLATTLAGGQRLYRAPSDAPFAYRSAEPATVAEVAVGHIGGLAQSSTAEMSFRVTIDPAFAGTIPNTGQSHYNDAVSPGATSVVSNTVLLTVVAGTGPDLTLSKSHVGNFQTGQPGNYTLQATNVGSAATSGVIRVVDTLPAGMNFVSATGPQWSCSVAGQTITCVSPQALGAGAVSTPIQLTVNVPPASISPGPTQVFVNTAVVSGGSEPAANNGNNSAADATTVALGASLSGSVWLDLNHDRVRQGTEPLLAGWRVELLNGAGNTLVSNATTGASGQYTIAGVSAGAAYKVRFASPSGVWIGIPVDGESGAPVSGATVNAATGMLENMSLVAGASVGEQSLPVDPSGVVYNSVTRTAVAGATITIEGPPGFDPSAHLIGGAANQSQTTAADGLYQFLLTSSAPPGLYRLQVVAPGGFQPGASASIPAQATPLDVPVGPGAFAVQAQNGPPTGAQPTTYYLAFVMQPGDQGVVNNHIPVDPTSVSGLFLRKAASKTLVELVDFVDYIVTVRNSTGAARTSFTITDRLPQGFAYWPGSARLNGSPIADPVGAAGPQLTFSFPTLTLADGAEASVSYRLRVGQSAALGDGINRALAATGSIQSNTASAKVRVMGGVFSEDGFIVGKVFTDCNRNRVQDAGEVGVPGVRIFIEDGSSAVTDSEGKYSFYGIKPLTHVAKVDPTTLPLGSALAVLDNRNARSPGTRFVDLNKGELAKADFAIGTCTPEVIREIERRRALGEVLVAETEAAARRALSAGDTEGVGSDPRTLPATGIVGAENAAKVFTPLWAGDADGARPSNLPPLPVQPVPSVALDNLLPKLDNALGFIDLKDGATLPMAQANVRVKGRMGTQLRLSVNGHEVPASRVGQRALLEARGVQALEYVGVALTPGKNALTLEELDVGGNVRATLSIGVIAPGEAGRIELTAPAAAPADGHTGVEIVVRVVDRDGVVVTARTPLTLEASLGRWQVEDLDARQPGVQVFVEGGRATYLLLPPETPGSATLRVASGALEARTQLAFVPELREMIALGVLEGVINVRNLSLSALQPATKRDGFERELLAHSYSFDNGKGTAAGRAAFFLKGKIKGKYLLTAAYDSEKDTRERLFRDIRPDEFYPVYGDSSVRGFDAQSTSHLYVRVDHDRSYLLWGDFTTQSADEFRSLTQYSRSLTGAKGHYENERLSVNGFATQESARQIVEEFTANGTSGPFQLAFIDIFVNSEQVEILTRDRNQPEIVLKTVRLARFTDYEYDALTGRLLLKAPVPSVDANLNPNSVRVTYEADQGGEKFWITGVDAQVKLGERTQIGGVYAHSADPADPYTLAGATGAVKLGPKTILFGEAASSDTETKGQGAAARAELRHQDERLSLRVHAAKSDEDFVNPNSTLGPGRTEAGAKADYRLSPKTMLKGEAVYTEDNVNHGERTGVFAGVERALNDQMRLEVGVRGAHETTAPPQPSAIGATPNDLLSARLRLTTLVPGLPTASAYGEYEQDLTDSDKRLAALGGDWQFLPRARVYGRYEFISSLSGPYALNDVQRSNVGVLGVDANYMENGAVFSEYRVRDAIAGRDSEAAIGLRNTWALANGWRLSTSFERTDSLDSIAGNDSTAATAAFEYLADPRLKLTARVEGRVGEDSDGLLQTIGIAYKLDRDWTLLARSQFYEEWRHGFGTFDLLRMRQQIGFAWRETQTNVWNALARYEHRFERGTDGADASHRAHIFAANLNWQPTRDQVLTGRLATKLVDDSAGGFSSSYWSSLIGGRITWNLTERWDVGLQSFYTVGRASTDQRTAFGVEAGYLIDQNLWLSVGYNVFGFRDDELAGDEYTDGGVYLRLRFKFDESLLRRPL